MNYARSREFGKGPALLPRSFFTFHQLMQAKIELVKFPFPSGQKRNLGRGRVH